MWWGLALVVVLMVSGHGERGLLGTPWQRCSGETTLRMGTGEAPPGQAMRGQVGGAERGESVWALRGGQATGPLGLVKHMGLRPRVPQGGCVAQAKN